ncbi:MAG TPA: PD-(D/E)XK nuclease family protein [Anaerolineae bacterium]|nr:PD-(D/E)XK nuclease family protein [Anaerolineae bacterium]
MILPTDFQFSQGSLQDYVDCPRRFHLRYVQRLAWPAIDAEPALENERYLQQGAAFHRLAHQHALGIPADKLAVATDADDADIRRWWRNYLQSGPAGLPAIRYPEVVLSAPLEGYRLLARYDLVAIDPAMGAATGRGQRVVIVDWKTSRRRTPRERLQGRLQTRVYPFLLVQAGSHLNNVHPVLPEQVEMVYWFSDFPADPERFSYDQAQHEADEAYLAELIGEIAGRTTDEDFPLTADERRCRYCRYRSLCRRGERAGLLDDDDGELAGDFDSAADPDAFLDIEQIAEIEY